MKEDVGFFSWAVYCAVIIYFIGFMCMTIVKWSRKEFVSSAFPIGALVSSGCALLLSVSEIFCFGEVSGEMISDIVFASVPIYALLVHDGNSSAGRNMSLAVSFISFATFVVRMACRSFLGGTGHGASLSVVVFLVVAAAMASCIYRRMGNVDKWCRRSNFASDVKDKVNTIYLLILLACQEAGVWAGYGRGWTCRAVLLISFLLVLCLYAGIYARLTTGRIFLLFKDKEKMINDSMKAYLSDMSSGDSKNDVCYRAIFEKLVEYFDTDKPFLDGNLNITDVAKKLLTNRLYLSRTINIYTGRNFCQYVNYHRIRYSVKKFQADPQLKTADLAAMSGFNSLVSFNMAFRLYMNISPGEWCRSIREASRKK